MIKNIISHTLLLFICLAAVNNLYSQNKEKIIKKNFSVEGQERIWLNLEFANKIKIIGWNKEKVRFKATIATNDGGRLYDALQLEFDKTDGVFKVTSSYNKELLKKGSIDDCPDDLSSYSINGEIYICNKINYKVYIPTNAGLKVETISGNITITGVSGSIKANTISGFIDLTRPPKSGADLSISTISGQAYTNVEDLKIIDKEVTGWSLSIKGLLNGGGPDVTLETISGNIYLREG